MFTVRFDKGETQHETEQQAKEVMHVIATATEHPRTFTEVEPGVWVIDPINDHMDSTSAPV